MKIIMSDDELREKLKAPLVPSRLPMPEVVEGNLNIPSPSQPFRPTLPDVEVVQQATLGRPVGSTQMDGLTRELIAMDAGLGLVPQKHIARVHDTTQAEVSFLGRAMNQTNIEGQKQDPELYARITQKKYNIIDTATSKLLDTLGLFEPSCLDQKQMPGAALSISAVIERLEGRANVNNAAPVSFHIYAPRTRHEDQYEVIQVNE